MLSLTHLLPGQNGRRFADDMFKCIFLNENMWISNEISLKYVLWVLIDNIQYVSTGLDNGLAPSKRQVIIWTNADRRIYAAIGGGWVKLTPWLCLLTELLMDITRGKCKLHTRYMEGIDKVVYSILFFIGEKVCHEHVCYLRSSFHGGTDANLLNPGSADKRIR